MGILASVAMDQKLPRRPKGLSDDDGERLLAQAKAIQRLVVEGRLKLIGDVPEWLLSDEFAGLARRLGVGLKNVRIERKS